MSIARAAGSRPLAPEMSSQQKRMRPERGQILEIGKGRVMTRFQTRGRGRAAGIIKPFSHLTIVVRERAEAEDK